MENETIIIDSAEKGFPSILHKETELNERGYVECIVGIKNQNDTYIGEIIKISSSGRYTIKIMRKE